MNETHCIWIFHRLAEVDLDGL
jgi:hypothetical protein